MLNALDPDEAARCRRRGGDIETADDVGCELPVEEDSAADAKREWVSKDDSMELVSDCEDGNVALLGKGVGAIAPGIFSIGVTSGMEELPARLFLSVLFDVVESKSNSSDACTNDLCGLWLRARCLGRGVFSIEGLVVVVALSLLEDGVIVAIDASRRKVASFCDENMVTNALVL